MTNNSVPKIAIIGAGPGGLALAAILLKNNNSPTVFESDASPNERSQGGSLDIHATSGQIALREAGLWNDFAKHARAEADVMKMVDQKSGEVLFDSNGVDAVVVPEEHKFEHRPEIDRAALRSILLMPSMTAGCIEWNMRLSEVLPADDNKHDLHFKNGTIEKGFDLVVGAEGAWSKVRKLITDVKPYYSGISALELWANDVDTNNKWMSEYVGKGSLFSFDEGRAIQIQRQGDHSIKLYASLRKPESFIEDCSIDWNNPDTAREQYVNTYFSDICDDLKRVLLESKDQSIPRKLYMLPVGANWTNKPGLTLLGDAAHLMTPFAGVGVNAALLDSLMLARAIISHVQDSEKSSLDQAIKRYEEDMFPRAKAFMQKTERGLIKHFSAGGNGDMVSRLRAARG